jgi:hypothetical protein
MLHSPLPGGTLQGVERGAKKMSRGYKNYRGAACRDVILLTLIMVEAGSGGLKYCLQTS